MNVDLVISGESSISDILMDIIKVIQSDRSVVDTVVDETIHHEAADNGVERVCEAVRLAGKELSEDERLHITNSTVSFSSNCRVYTSGRKPKSWKLNTQL